MNIVTDIIIIGAGTAGLTAAIYARRSGQSVIIFERQSYGGQIINTPDIENYPGISHISGFEFATNLYEQAMSFNCDFRFEEVEEIIDEETHKLVKTNYGVYQCKSVIIATGAKNRPLGLENETKLIGKGISYCATCDGMFYKNKIVCVNGGGNTAIEDATFLSKYCKLVYLVHRRDQFRADSKDVDELKKKDNVKFIYNSVIDEINGDEFLNSITIKNVITNETSKLDIQGLFIAIGQMPDNSKFTNVVDLDEKGYIIASENCKTKTKGIYAAGDCRTKDIRQLTTAASDGAIAALAASKQ